MQERLTIADPEVARTLVETKNARLLEPFMKRDRSAGEAARELNVKLPYHIERFLAFGLLEVVRLEPRPGRAVKRYRSTAEAFFIPFHVTPSETLERLLSELTIFDTRRFEREVAHTLQNISPTWELYITPTESGQVSYGLTPDERGYAKPLLDVLFGPAAPAVFSTQGTLKLDFEAAKALQNKLADLERRHRAKHHDKGQTYAFRLGLTPARSGVSD